MMHKGDKSHVKASSVLYGIQEAQLAYVPEETVMAVS